MFGRISRRRQARAPLKYSMKRIGYIIEEIVSCENLEESIRYVLRGRRKGKSTTGKYLLEHKEEILKKMKADIESGEYKIPKYREFTINEKGKERVIQSIPLYDRVVVHAIMRVVEKHLTKRFIADSAASIKGRGGLYLLKRILKDMKNDPEGTQYIYKFDIRKFYQSIPQREMIEIVKRKFKDKRLINILSGFIQLLPSGISIGLRSSQVLGNLFLDYYLDHYIKDKLGVKYYRRYCDDIVVQGESKYALTQVIREIKQRIASIPGIEIKGNDQLFCIKDRCIDFLGYQVFWNGQIKIRKHIKKRFVKRWNRVKSTKRKVELIAALYAMTKHANAKNLFKTLTNTDMKTFAELGLTFTAKDGKKRFDVDSYSLGSLVNMKIIIEDFEKGIVTKEGDGRYVVKFRFVEEDESEGNEGKYFTNSEEMKQMLDKIADMDELPFLTTIKRTVFGKGKIKYVFS